MIVYAVGVRVDGLQRSNHQQHSSLSLSFLPLLALLLKIQKAHAKLTPLLSVSPTAEA